MSEENNLETLKVKLSDDDYDFLTTTDFEISNNPLSSQISTTRSTVCTGSCTSSCYGLCFTQAANAQYATTTSCYASCTTEAGSSACTSCSSQCGNCTNNSNSSSGGTTYTPTSCYGLCTSNCSGSCANGCGTQCHSSSTIMAVLGYYITYETRYTDTYFRAYATVFATTGQFVYSQSPIIDVCQSQTESSYLLVYGYGYSQYMYSCGIPVLKEKIDTSYTVPVVVEMHGTYNGIIGSEPVAYSYNYKA